jgi:hypothetical protein
MINCIEKTNRKKNKDFKLVYIKEGPEIIDRELTEKIEETQIKKNQLTKTSLQKKFQKIKTEKNPHKLNSSTTQWGIKMLIGTFPGNNRNEQITTLANTFGINKSSDLINVEHISGNSWFTGYFKNDQERLACLTAINKSSSSTRIKATKLDIIPKKTNKKKDVQIQKGKNVIRHETQTAYQDIQMSQVKILDIPLEFSYNRILGALKRYRWIRSSLIIKEEKGTKSVVVTFENIKIDLESTWSIPMGDIMARILPAEQMYLMTERNLITTRLYGIHKDTTPTRIMSAIKHLEAKSVHIPKNGKTGKRRSFAIISFQNQKSLEKALKSHVELFGCKTWWSSKDELKNKKTTNSPKNQKNTSQQLKSPYQDNLDLPSGYESSSSKSSMSSYHDNNKSTRHEVKSMSYSPQSFPTQHMIPDWSQMTKLLERIDNRLNKLEKIESQENNSGPSAHNRS